MQASEVSIPALLEADGGAIYCVPAQERPARHAPNFMLVLEAHAGIRRVFTLKNVLTEYKEGADKWSHSLCSVGFKRQEESFCAHQLLGSSLPLLTKFPLVKALCPQLSLVSSDNLELNIGSTY